VTQIGIRHMLTPTQACEHAFHRGYLYYCWGLEDTHSLKIQVQQLDIEVEAALAYTCCIQQPTPITIAISHRYV
jgi:hypothetical protein